MEPPASVLPPEFGDLLQSIAEGDCVLALGPRIGMPPAIAGSDAPIAEHLASHLLKDLGEERTESTTLREALMRYDQSKKAPFLRRRYRELVGALDQASTDLHRDLASLPFRLVLVATADRMMANAFRDVGKTRVQEADYNYCHGPTTGGLLSLPTTDKPIVYSLFGRHDHPESMVLTDKNLIDYLVAIIKGCPALPDPVRATLKAPSTVFLFVGFGFTSWWLRLLLKVLDITGVENRLPSLALEDGTFRATDASEQQAFFESAGIYIKAGDWNALAKELASRYRQMAARAKSRTKPLAAASGDGRRPPLVFLSYASEDADTVDRLRQGLEARGISVWQDSQNLRAGQNWKARIADYIQRVDYFVFVQTENMDRRGPRADGVYNGELKLALERAQYKRDDVVFVIHVTVGHTEPRPEPELAKLHRIGVDTDEGIARLASHILESFESAPATGSVRIAQLT